MSEDEKGKEKVKDGAESGKFWWTREDLHMIDPKHKIPNYMQDKTLKIISVIVFSGIILLGVIYARYQDEEKQVPDHPEIDLFIL